MAKLILTDRQAHKDAAFHLASSLYENYNIGSVRLKFSIDRSTTKASEQIPGLENCTPEDVILGLHEGFDSFRKKNPDFEFFLSPSFRKESEFFDKSRFKNKRDHFLHLVDLILDLKKKYSFLKESLAEVDTVGDEKELYRKIHFEEMKSGLRKLQYNGFHVRSHHGETWKSLKKGVQSVDNAMNIWHINTLEHGLSLGLNPNYYFHRLYQRVMGLNLQKSPLSKGSNEFNEIMDMEWQDAKVRDKLIKGQPLKSSEQKEFIKTKFHTAREIEHYQHDVLNRMINKNVGLISLPTSNMKLTDPFPDFKDHPFSWWEKKGVNLGVGTDNYITLSTNFIKEMLILLYSDPEKLKITKLLMITTGEKRRPHISHLLWGMRKKLKI